MWKEQLENRFLSPTLLLEKWGFEKEYCACAEAAAKRFPFEVTPYYLSLIQTPASTDPIFRMVIPDPMELKNRNWESGDPLDETQYSPVPGIIHKYPGRVLMLTVDKCAVRCRFCFRRGCLKNDAVNDRMWAPALNYIDSHQDIREVVLSGGDPLTLDDATLRILFSSLKRINHVKSLRIHTRVPAVLPQRVNRKLAEVLKTAQPLWVVSHFNHPVEMTEAVDGALDILIQAGIPMLNQSVFLKGVNDTVDILEALCQKLIERRIKPYYLHLLDPAAGTSHFKAGERRARVYISELAARLPGFAVPNLVRDIPGQISKTILR